MAMSRLIRIFEEDVKMHWPEEVTKGKSYMVGTNANKTACKFMGWKVDSDGPKMIWKDDKDGDTWEAYMYEGRMVLGSSAQTLEIGHEI